MTILLQKIKLLGRNLRFQIKFSSRPERRDLLFSPNLTP
jgi:hypothetical protein